MIGLGSQKKLQFIDRHSEKQTNDYYLSSTPSSYGPHCSTLQLNRIASSATSFGTGSHIIACDLGSCQCVWGTGTAPPQVPARPQRLLLQRQVFQGRDSLTIQPKVDEDPTPPIKSWELIDDYPGLPTANS